MIVFKNGIAVKREIALLREGRF